VTTRDRTGLDRSLPPVAGHGPRSDARNRAQHRPFHFTMISISSVAAILLVAASTSVSACGLGSPMAQASPSDGGAAAVSPARTAVPTPTAAAEKTYRVADLPAIVLKPSQMSGWQTATRADLTGPFTATTNTNPQENPQPVASFRAGYRQTIGDPGGRGVNTVHTALELFDDASSAYVAVLATVASYAAAGYTQQLDISSLGLGPDATGRSGVDVAIAPQFAQGSVKKGMAFIWRSGNLLVIQVDGGDSAATPLEATKWVESVEANVQAHGSIAPAQPGWLTYTHPRWGYSLRYPDAWFDLDNFGVPDSQKYFSNERVGAPLQLDQNGIWLTIGVLDGNCPTSPSSGRGERQLAVGSETVTRTTGRLESPGGEGGWTIGADVPGASQCFSFRYIASTQQARDANLDTADEMISSFRVL
jgi:hypothetical protein